MHVLKRLQNSLIPVALLIVSVSSHVRYTAVHLALEWLWTLSVVREVPELLHQW